MHSQEWHMVSMVGGTHGHVKLWDNLRAWSSNTFFWSHKFLPIRFSQHRCIYSQSTCVCFKFDLASWFWNHTSTWRHLRFNHFTTPIFCFGLSVVCSLKVSSSTVVCSFERQSFFIVADSPPSLEISKKLDALSPSFSSLLLYFPLRLETVLFGDNTIAFSLQSINSKEHDMMLSLPLSRSINPKS